VVTDGATEAMNPRREFFGVERLRAKLSAVAQESTPAEVIARLREEVTRFADGAEAADDITLMAMRWEGTTLR
jgi:serine phosphatase RsbU (regulator of sigma subunit)